MLLLALVPAAPAFADLPYAVPTPVATGPGTQGSPSLDRTTSDPCLAWEDDAGGQWDVIQLFRSLIVPVPAGASAQRHPAGDGYLVVYEDDRAGNWDIFAYDTFPGDAFTPPPAVPERQLSTGVADQLDPDIWNLTVVYEDRSRGNWDIAVYDLATGTGRLLTSHAADQVDPAIDGDRVVFADRRNGNWDVCCYDLARKTVKRLTTSTATQVKPHVRGEIVVWQDKRNGDWDVYAYNFKTGKERRLTTDRHDQTSPQFSGERSVVYEDDRAGTPDIWVCDLKTGLQRRLTDGPAAETGPTAAGRLVAWRDTGADAGDVYRATLLYPSLELSCASTAPAYDSTVRFTGYLRLDHGTADGRKVKVSGSGGTRTVEVVPVDATTGRFSVSLSHVVRKVSLRALFDEAGYLPDKAGPVTVKPKALLTRPSLSALPRGMDDITARDAVITGYLKPRHPAGTSAVKVEIWRYALDPMRGLTWTRVKTVSAKVADYAGYSRYQVKVRLATIVATAKYKVRALHADADHAATVSSFSAVRDLQR